MLRKIAYIALAVAVAIVAFLFMNMTMPAYNGIVNSVNATITAEHDLSKYPGTQGALLASPLILIFVPFVAAGIIIVVKLKQRSQR